MKNFVPNLANKSRLDVIFEKLEGVDILSTPSGVSSDDLLTEGAIIELIGSLGLPGGIVKLEYKDHPNDPNVMLIVGYDSTNRPLTYIDIPNTIKDIIYRPITLEDIDNGVNSVIGTPALEFQYADVIKVIPLNGLNVKGSSSNSILTSVNSGVVKSKLLIDKNKDSVIRTDVSDFGVYSDLIIDDNSNTGITLEKEAKGLTAYIPIKKGSILKFKELTWEEYSILESKDPTTLYLISNKPLLYYNELEIGAFSKDVILAELLNKVNKSTTINGHSLENDVVLTKDDILLSNVTNDALVKRSELGVTVATLDESGKILSTQLPSYVDDIIEYNSTSLFPSIGESGKIYVSKDTNLTYRWTGSGYVEISQSLALGETSSTAYAGDKGKAIKDSLDSHISNTDNPHNVTAEQVGLGNVDNTSDLDKPISTLQLEVNLNFLNLITNSLTSISNHISDTNNPHEVTKTLIGLSNVDNTSDANKPISTALASAIADAKKSGSDAQISIDTHTSDKSNPHEVTKVLVGLGNVTNESKITMFTSPAFTGIPTAPTADTGTNTTQIATTEFVHTSIANVVANAPTDFDTLKEIADWIADHPEDTTAMNSQINLNKSDITTIKTKLDGIESGALVNTITSVAGKTGDVTLVKGDVGLGNVDNTSDLDKPVSTATQTAITNAINALDSSVTSKDGNNVLVRVTTANGKISNVNITTDNTANNTDLINHKNNQDKKHIPEGGLEKLILSWKSNGEAKWESLSNIFTGLEEVLAYGIEWDITVTDPHLTRIGNMSLHKTLPIQSQLKGCIAQGNKIIYWLDEDDWRYKKGGNPNKGEIELLSRLDGYDGTVRVYCSDFYIKSEIDGNKRRVWLSTIKIDDSWTYQPACLIDAYRSTILRTVPTDMGYLSTLPVNSAVSIMNTNTYCRGGHNDSSYDLYFTTDPFRSLLGKPATNIPRASMRTYSRNAGSEMLSYDCYKNIFYWLYIVEYANFNCLEEFNPALTDEGYKQGGMGAGLTTMYGNWQYYNYWNPICPCGYTNEFGNKTGIKDIIIPEFTYTSEGVEKIQATLTLKAIRWRGFENTFGDIWTNVDGIIIDANDHPNNMNYVYTCLDPSKFVDTITEDYKKVGEEIHEEGYTKLFDLETTALIIPNVMGGSTTQGKCDYHWVGNKNTTLRTVLFGGSADDGGVAGLGFFYSNCGVGYSHVYLSFRSFSVASSSVAN